MIKKSKVLAGKKILFFAPAFFGYEIKIRNKMEELGAEVVFYDERAVTGSFNKALLKISPRIFNYQADNYYNKIISENNSIYFDYVFIIKCDMVTSKILEKLHACFNSAKFCLYLWDSFVNIPNIEMKLKYFDTVFSFDRSDVNKNNKLNFLPLFFSDDFQSPRQTKIEYKYDISFCGTIHSNRLDYIKQVSKLCERQHLKFYLFGYLQSEFIFYFYKITKKSFCNTSKNYFSFSKKSGSEVALIEKNSRAVLDIPHPKQLGLTMRTIELIGLNKKIITSNKDIKNYDFYNQNNIFIINKDTREIPEDFIRSKYIDIPPNIYDKYSLSSWIKAILV